MRTLFSQLFAHLASSQAQQAPAAPVVVLPAQGQQAPAASNSGVSQSLLAAAQQAHQAAQGQQPTAPIAAIPVQVEQVPAAPVAVTPAPVQQQPVAHPEQPAAPVAATPAQGQQVPAAPSNGVSPSLLAAAQQAYQAAQGQQPAAPAAAAPAPVQQQPVAHPEQPAASVAVTPAPAQQPAAAAQGQQLSSFSEATSLLWQHLWNPGFANEPEDRRTAVLNGIIERLPMSIQTAFYTEFHAKAQFGDKPQGPADAIILWAKGLIGQNLKFTEDLVKQFLAKNSTVRR
jgi:hypothetical protein